MIQSKSGVKLGNFKANLAEIYQATQIKFAFLSAPKDGNKQCHPFVLCRDFLNDAVRTTISQRESTIYGFSYSVKSNPPVDLKKTRILVTKDKLNTEKDINNFQEMLTTSLSLINHYENMVGWPLSKLYKVKNSNTWLFVGNPGWVHSPFLLSLYTMLIRLGDKKEIISGFTAENLNLKYDEIINKYKNSNDNDAKYLETIKNDIDLILLNKNHLFFDGGKYDSTYTEDYSISIFHNSSGITSLCKYSAVNVDIVNKFKKLKTTKKENKE